MHTCRRPSSRVALFSGCFKRFTGSPKLLQEINDFEETLGYELDALMPKEGGEVLQLSWLTSVLTLAYSTHVQAVSLVPPPDLPLLFFDEKWMNDHMDQTTRILDICNVLTGVFCNIEQSHLLIRHACHVLLDVEKAPLQGEAAANVAPVLEEQLSRAQKSLRKWLELQVSHEPQKCSEILEDMSKGLVPPEEKDVHKGKGFLCALYGANVTVVFALYVLAMAVSDEKEIVAIILPVASTFGWSTSVAELVELAKEDAKQHAGQSFCVEDLRVLEMRVRDLFSLIEHSLELKKQPLLEEDARKLAGAVNEMCLLLDDVAKGLESLGTKLNDMFKAIVLSRSSLLEKLGDFVSDEK